MFSAVGISTRRLVTETFSSNTTWTAPMSTYSLQQASGKGAAGTPSYRDPNTTSSLEVTHVQGASGAGGGPHNLMDWSEFASHNSDMLNKVNAGGSGSDGSGHWSYTQYSDNTAFFDSDPLSWSDVVAGSASLSTTGWKSSGPVVAGDNGSAVVSFTKLGTYHPATTGASSTGFGKTFPGGTGGAASTTIFTDVVVTPGASYNLVIPAGGLITITYYK